MKDQAAVVQLPGPWTPKWSLSSRDKKRLKQIIALCAAIIGLLWLLYQLGQYTIPMGAGPKSYIHADGDRKMSNPVDPALLRIIPAGLAGEGKRLAGIAPPLLAGERRPVLPADGAGGNETGSAPVFAGGSTSGIPGTAGTGTQQISSGSNGNSPAFFGFGNFPMPFGGYGGGVGPVSNTSSDKSCGNGVANSGGSGGSSATGNSANGTNTGGTTCRNGGGNSTGNSGSGASGNSANGANNNSGASGNSTDGSNGGGNSGGNGGSGAPDNSANGGNSGGNGNSANGGNSGGNGGSGAPDNSASGGNSGGNGNGANGGNSGGNGGSGAPDNSANGGNSGGNGNSANGGNSGGNGGSGASGNGGNGGGNGDSGNPDTNGNDGGGPSGGPLADSTPGPGGNGGDNPGSGPSDSSNPYPDLSNPPPFGNGAPDGGDGGPSGTPPGDPTPDNSAGVLTPTVDVPEPNSMALFAGGLLLVLAALRRRKGPGSLPPESTSIDLPDGRSSGARRVWLPALVGMAWLAITFDPASAETATVYGRTASIFSPNSGAFLPANTNLICFSMNEANCWDGNTWQHLYPSGRRHYAVAATDRVACSVILAPSNDCWTGSLWYRLPKGQLFGVIGGFFSDTPGAFITTPLRSPPFTYTTTSLASPLGQFATKR